MLTADVNDKKNTFKVAFLTIMSIFIMGYLNALALNTYALGMMITPQTGNVIWMGIYAASGYWGYFLETVGLFFGFMGGAIFALFTQHLFRNKSTQFFWNWSFFIVPIVAYPFVMQYIVPPVAALFLLGFSAGATLGFFRKVYHMEINTSMATGNVRFLGIHFAGAFLKKNKKEISTFWIFFIAVFAFAFGAFFYGIFARIDVALAHDVYVGLGSPPGPMRYGYDVYERLTLGLGDLIYQSPYYYYRLPADGPNLVRTLALVAFCLMPYLFCPKHKKGE
ncbi:MAG: DUF1275 domain-containing protein [Defluviitaleaceae bacterium]|nr:DUF1275 domain-containing protein [Defluviitaleaceae bacterium]